MALPGTPASASVSSFGPPCPPLLAPLRPRIFPLPPLLPLPALLPQVTFKVKRTTRFEKIIQAFCSRKAVDPQQVRFIYDGQRILPSQTPADFDMENDDTIDAFLEQVGGC